MRQANDITPRPPIRENQAPRGSQANPTDYALCQPFCMTNGIPFLSIESVDVFPVPEGNGHSNLTNQAISCVGDYVNQWYNNVVSYNGTQRIPLWVTEQAFSWGPACSVAVEFCDTYEYIGEVTYQPQSAGSWQQISDTTIVPPATAVSAYIVCLAKSPGTYNYDDITFSQNGVGTDLLSNSNMETGSPANWAADGGAGVTQTWDTSSYHSATHSLKTAIVEPMCPAAGWVQGPITVSPSNTYSLSAWVNASVLAGAHTKFDTGSIHCLRRHNKWRERPVVLWSWTDRQCWIVPVPLRHWHLHV